MEIDFQDEAKRPVSAFLHCFVLFRPLEDWKMLIHTAQDECSSLSPPIRGLTSSRNTLKTHPKVMFSQLSGHLLAYHCWCKANYHVFFLAFFSSWYLNHLQICLPIFSNQYVGIVRVTTALTPVPQRVPGPGVHQKHGLNARLDKWIDASEELVWGYFLYWHFLVICFNYRDKSIMKASCRHWVHFSTHPGVRAQ